MKEQFTDNPYLLLKALYHTKISMEYFKFNMICAYVG